MKNHVVLEDQVLAFVVRKDGEPGIYLAPGLCTNEQAAQLLEMMATRLRQELATVEGPRERDCPCANCPYCACHQLPGSVVTVG